MGNGLLTVPDNAEWGTWECPVCHVESQDPDTIWLTSCPNGHIILLGAVHHPTIADGYLATRAWRSAEAGSL